MTEPTDAELEALLVDKAPILALVGANVRTAVVKAMREAFAKWGTPTVVAPWRSAVLDLIDECPGLTMEQDQWLSRRVKELDFVSTPQPTQAQAGAVPLTPIRQAALGLYKPPFRHEHGYIRDANNQIVSDDASSVATGLIAARIRGWGRIQYMDKPEQRAAALQDEVAEMVAEALNAYWAANGIKGGQHG